MNEKMSLGHDPKMMGQQAPKLNMVKEERPVHPEGIRGEQVHAMENLHTLTIVHNRIWNLLTGEPTPEHPYPHTSCSQERAKAITDLSNHVLAQARSIAEHLRD